jgi:hypothetical protein
MTRKEAAFCLLSLAAGVVVLAAAIIEPAVGRVDWPWYQSTGRIILCLLAAGLAFLEPRHAWRWGLLPIIVVPPWVLWRTDGYGTMWPIFMLIFLHWAIAPVISAYAGVLLRYWLVRRP